MPTESLIESQGTTALPIGDIIKDYAKICQPSMAVALSATAVIGYMMAVEVSDPVQILILGVTALFAAAGAKALNQCSEVELDKLMVRTQNRPLPTGRISLRNAKIMGWTFSIGSTATMAVAFHPMTAILSALTVFSYIFIYTPLKQRSTFNTVIGAFPGAFPIWGGWFAGGGGFDDANAGIILFAIMFLWQFPHFLAIAWLCKDDYAAAGFKMLPIIDPEGRLTGRQIVVYSGTLVMVTLLPTILLGMTSTLYLAAVAIAGVNQMRLAAKFHASPGKPTALSLLKFAYLHLLIIMTLMVIDKV